MKIRNNFVSNSSSTSFCIVGVVVDDNFDFEKISKCKPCLVEAGYDDESIANMSIAELMQHTYNNTSGEKFRKLFADMEVRYGVDNYSGDTVAGCDIELMKDEETLAHFKKSVFDKLKKLGFNGELSEVKILIDGGYEG